MKKSEILNLVTNISEKFHNINKQADMELQCDVLHAALLEVYGDFTEKEYSDLPLTFKKTLEKLDKAIFKNVSQEYKKTVEKCYSEFSIFAPEQLKVETKIKTRVKTNIGYIKE